MHVISDLVSVKDERWVWPTYDNFYTFNALVPHLDLIEHVRPFLKKKNVMVQAGGNCGMFIEPFVREFAQVYTFEPDPINFYCLTMNLPYSHVIKFQACLGDTHRLVAINNNFTSAVKESGAIHVEPSGIGRNVPTFRIDDLGLGECDYIQLDTEGFEYFGIMGGIETIKKFKPVICAETVWSTRYGIALDKVEKFLCGELGYTIKDKHDVDVIYVCDS